MSNRGPWYVCIYIYTYVCLITLYIQIEGERQRARERERENKKRSYRLCGIDARVSSKLPSALHCEKDPDVGCRL